MVFGCRVICTHHTTQYTTRPFTTYPLPTPPTHNTPQVKRSGWQPPTDTGLWKVADTVQDRVWHELPPVSMDHLKAQTHFFDQVTSISGRCWLCICFVVVLLLLLLLLLVVVVLLLLLSLLLPMYRSTIGV